MIKNIAMFCLLLLPTMTYAQLESQFTFSGQNAEVLKAEKKITIVTPEQVEVPDTCYRQVPNGQVRVCRDETRYRQECSWIPSSERCWNDQERVCRTVTRYREECSGSPSREVCTDRPSRQVCTERPTREVCTTRPDGRQHCTTVGGGQHCTTVGGGRDCHTVPGNRTCRQVPYSDQDCDYVTRRRCETIPGRNDCRQIPYSEQVCGMETQYRTESYACTRTQTINRTTEKTVKSETNVQIITNGIVEEFPVAVSVKETSQQFSAFSIEAKLLKEPKAFVVLQKKSSKIASSTEKEIVLQNSIVLEILTQEMLPVSFPVSIASAHIEEASNKMVIVFDGAMSAQGSIDFQITHKAFLSSTKTLVEMKADYPSAKVELGAVADKAALSIDIKDAIKKELKKKNMKLKFNLTSALNLQGEIMNATKPSTSKLYEGTFVELK